MYTISEEDSAEMGETAGEDCEVHEACSNAGESASTSRSSASVLRSCVSITRHTSSTSIEDHDVTSQAHYECAFVRLVRDQIQRFDTSWEHWQSEATVTSSHSNSNYPIPYWNITRSLLSSDIKDYRHFNNANHEECARLPPVYSCQSEQENMSWGVTQLCTDKYETEYHMKKTHFNNNGHISHPSLYNNNTSTPMQEDINPYKQKYPYMQKIYNPPEHQCSCGMHTYVYEKEVFPRTYIPPTFWNESQTHSLYEQQQQQQQQQHEESHHHFTQSFGGQEQKEIFVSTVNHNKTLENEETPHATNIYQVNTPLQIENYLEWRNDTFSDFEYSLQNGEYATCSMLHNEYETSTLQENIAEVIKIKGRGSQNSTFSTNVNAYNESNIINEKCVCPHNHLAQSFQEQSLPSCYSHQQKQKIPHKFIEEESMAGETDIKSANSVHNSPSNYRIKERESNISTATHIQPNNQGNKRKKTNNPPLTKPNIIHKKSTHNKIIRGDKHIQALKRENYIQSRNIIPYEPKHKYRDSSIYQPNHVKIEEKYANAYSKQPENLESNNIQCFEYQTRQEHNNEIFNLGIEVKRQDDSQNTKPKYYDIEENQTDWDEHQLLWEDRDPTSEDASISSSSRSSSDYGLSSASIINRKKETETFNSNKTCDQMTLSIQESELSIPSDVNYLTPNDQEYSCFVGVNKILINERDSQKLQKDSNISSKKDNENQVTSQATLALKSENSDVQNELKMQVNVNDSIYSLNTVCESLSTRHKSEMRNKFQTTKESQENLNCKKKGMQQKINDEVSIIWLRIAEKEKCNKSFEKQSREHESKAEYESRKIKSSEHSESKHHTKDNLEIRSNEEETLSEIQYQSGDTFSTFLDKSSMTDEESLVNMQNKKCMESTSEFYQTLKELIPHSKRKSHSSKQDISQTYSENLFKNMRSHAQTRKFPLNDSKFSKTELKPLTVSDLTFSAKWKKAKKYTIKKNKHKKVITSKRKKTNVSDKTWKTKKSILIHPSITERHLLAKTVVIHAKNHPDPKDSYEAVTMVHDTQCLSTLHTKKQNFCSRDNVLNYQMSLRENVTNDDEIQDEQSQNGTEIFLEKKLLSEAKYYETHPSQQVENNISHLPTFQEILSCPIQEEKDNDIMFNDSIQDLSQIGTIKNVDKSNDKKQNPKINSLKGQNNILISESQEASNTVTYLSHELETYGMNSINVRFESSEEERDISKTLISESNNNIVSIHQYDPPNFTIEILNGTDTSQTEKSGKKLYSKEKLECHDTLQRKEFSIKTSNIQVCQTENVSKELLRDNSISRELSQDLHHNFLKECKQQEELSGTTEEKEKISIKSKTETETNEVKLISDAKILPQQIHDSCQCNEKKYEWDKSVPFEKNIRGFETSNEGHSQICQDFKRDVHSHKKRNKNLLVEAIKDRNINQIPPVHTKDLFIPQESSVLIKEQDFLISTEDLTTPLKENQNILDQNEHKKISEMELRKQTIQKQIQTENTCTVSLTVEENDTSSLTTVQTYKHITDLERNGVHVASSQHKEQASFPSTCTPSNSIREDFERSEKNNNTNKETEYSHKGSSTTVKEISECTSPSQEHDLHNERNCNNLTYRLKTETSQLQHRELQYEERSKISIYMVKNNDQTTIHGSQTLPSPSSSSPQLSFKEPEVPQSTFQKIKTLTPIKLEPFVLENNHFCHNLKSITPLQDKKGKRHCTTQSRTTASLLFPQSKPTLNNHMEGIPHSPSQDPSYNICNTSYEYTKPTLRQTVVNIARILLDERKSQETNYLEGNFQQYEKMDDQTQEKIATLKLITKQLFRGELEPEQILPHKECTKTKKSIIPMKKKCHSEENVIWNKEVPVLFEENTKQDQLYSLKKVQSLNEPESKFLLQATAGSECTEWEPSQTQIFYQPRNTNKQSMELIRELLLQDARIILDRQISHKMNTSSDEKEKDVEYLNDIDDIPLVKIQMLKRIAKKLILQEIVLKEHKSICKGNQPKKLELNLTHENNANVLPSKKLDLTAQKTFFISRAESTPGTKSTYLDESENKKSSMHNTSLTEKSKTTAKILLYNFATDTNDDLTQTSLKCNENTDSTSNEITKIFTANIINNTRIPDESQHKIESIQKYVPPFLYETFQPAILDNPESEDGNPYYREYIVAQMPSISSSGSTQQTTLTEPSQGPEYESTENEQPQIIADEKTITDEFPDQSNTDASSFNIPICDTNPPHETERNLSQTTVDHKNSFPNNSLSHDQKRNPCCNCDNYSLHTSFSPPYLQKRDEQEYSKEREAGVYHNPYQLSLDITYGPPHYISSKSEISVPTEGSQISVKPDICYHEHNLTLDHANNTVIIFEDNIVDKSDSSDDQCLCIHTTQEGVEFEYESTEIIPETINEIDVDIHMTPCTPTEQTYQLKEPCTPCQSECIISNESAHSETVQNITANITLQSTQESKIDEDKKIERKRKEQSGKKISNHAEEKRKLEVKGKREEQKEGREAKQVKEVQKRPIKKLPQEIKRKRSKSREKETKEIAKEKEERKIKVDRKNERTETSCPYRDTCCPCRERKEKVKKQNKKIKEVRREEKRTKENTRREEQRGKELKEQELKDKWIRQAIEYTRQKGKIGYRVCCCGCENEFLYNLIDVLTTHIIDEMCNKGKTSTKVNPKKPTKTITSKESSSKVTKKIQERENLQQNIQSTPKQQKWHKYPAIVQLGFWGFWRKTMLIIIILLLLLMLMLGAILGLAICHSHSCTKDWPIILKPLLLPQSHSPIRMHGVT